jgi:threonine dehydratase
VRKFSDDNCTLHITGKNFDECLNKARNKADDNGNVFIHPFDDKDIVDGQGTIAVEIYEEVQPDIIIGCIGGGGLMAGISLYSKHVNPGCILYGAESEDCCAMYKSIKSGNVVSLKSYDTFVDGASVKEVGKLNYEICKKNLEQVLLIDNGLLCKNILELYQDDGIVTEPAGALAVSSLSKISKDILQNKNVVCIISGGNNDITRYPEISEIALRYDNLKHYFIIQFRQKPGELKKFVNNILGPNDDITRFEYIKKTNKSYGQVLVGVELTHPDDLPNIMQNLEENNFNYKYINDDELLMSYVV